MEPGILLLIGAIVGVPVLLIIRRRVAAARYRRGVQQMNDAMIAWFDAANSEKRFDPVWSTIDLEYGEFAALGVDAGLVEPRTKRYSTGGSIRVARGLRLNTRRYHSYQVDEVVDRGRFYITNERVIFLGRRRTTTIQLKDIISTSTGDPLLLYVYSARRKNPAVFNFPQFHLGALLIQLFGSIRFNSPDFPAGLEITAQLTAGEVELRVKD